MKSYWVRMDLHPITGVLIRRGKFGQTEKASWGWRKRLKQCCSSSQRIPSQLPAGASIIVLKDSYSEPSEGAQIFPIPWVWTLAPRTVEESISVVGSHPIHGDWLIAGLGNSYNIDAEMCKFEVIPIHIRIKSTQELVKWESERYI